MPPAHEKRGKLVVATGDPRQLLWQSKAIKAQQGQDTGEGRGVPSAPPPTQAEATTNNLAIAMHFREAGDLCAAPARLAGWLAHAPAAAASTPYIFPFPPA